MSLVEMVKRMEEMKALIRQRAWDLLEATYKVMATKHSGEALAARIAAVDLRGFERAIAKGLKKALARAKTLKAKAVYFEYDLDNGWDSGFFICPDYTPEAAEDDDWASDYEDEVPGPRQPELARIYEENPGFSQPSKTMGTTLYLIARTVAAFGRATNGVADEGVAICMGFHDQDPIVRIREA